MKPYSRSEKRPWIFLPGFLGHPLEVQPMLPKENQAVLVNFFYQGLDRPSPNTIDFRLSEISETDRNFKKIPDLLSSKILETLGMRRASEGLNLIAYSFGARIAFHLKNSRLASWIRHWVWISANPGIPLNATSERATRLQSDQHWSKKFRSEPLKSVMKAWNNQPVFFNSKPRTLPAGLCRESAAIALDGFSLARQDPINFESGLFDRDLFLYGEGDTKFREIYLKLGRDRPTLNIFGVKGAGHRILEDQPDHLRNFLRKPVN